MKLSHYQIISVFFCYSRVLQNFIIMVFRLTFRFPSAPDSPGLFPDRHPIRLTMCLLQTTPALLYLLLILIDRRGQHHRGLIDIHRTSTPTLDYVGHLPSATGSDVPMFRSAGFIKPLVFRSYQGGCGSWFMCACVCKYGVRVTVNGIGACA